MIAPRRTAIAIRHVAFEDLGLLGPVLDAAGWAVSYRDAAIDDLTAAPVMAADLLVVLGGPIGVYEGDIYPFLKTELALLEKRLAAGKPTLGICLGAQAMAKALGARVYFGGRKEIGWGKVALTEEGRTSALAPLGDAGATVLHWHGDTFDVPAGALHLASSDVYPNQAFAYGSKALALQFHLEADLLENWFVGHTCELNAAHISIPALRAETARVKPAVDIQARKIFSDWLAAIG